jgi:hypothetical protein
MVVSNQKRAVGLFSNREVAEQTLKELKASGFSMDKVSIIAKDADQDKQLGGAQMSDHVGDQDVGTPTGVVADALTTATWGGILVGLSSLALPGIGPILAAGSLGASLVTAVAGTGVGAVATGNLVRALADLGIPEAQARTYSDRLLAGNYLVIVDGTEDEIGRAEAIFSDLGIQEWSIYNSSQA